MLAAALPHPQAEHQHEEVPQGVGAGFGVVHPRLSEDAFVVLEGVLRGVTGRGLRHLDGVGVADAEVVVDLGVADGHPLGVTRGSLAAVRPAVRGDGGRRRQPADAGDGFRLIEF
jgi:hypothetical protein